MPKDPVSTLDPSPLVQDDGKEYKFRAKGARAQLPEIIQIYFLGDLNMTKIGQKCIKTLQQLWPADGLG